jgi:hypothetical protein
MNQYTDISTYVDQTQVNGYIVSAQRQVLTVEITYPFSGITGKTITIPKSYNLSKGYLDTKGNVNDRGRAAAERVLEEIYAAVLCVKNSRNKLLKMYANLINETHLTTAGLVREDQQEELLYSLFTYTNKRSHRKVSYDIFRQVVKKFVLDT